MFRLPLVFAGLLARAARRSKSSYLLHDGAWDLLMVRLEPRGDFAALRTRDVPWFRRRLLGHTVDYFMGYAVSGALTA